MTIQKKKLSQIHMDMALQLAPRLAESGVSTEMVATYLATAAQLLKARKEPAVLETLIDQAAEIPATEAAGLLADFFEQFKSWNTLSLGSLKLPGMEAPVKTAKNRPSSQASSSPN
jgi:hypothetical protein